MKAPTHFTIRAATGPKTFRISGFREAVPKQSCQDITSRNLSLKARQLTGGRLPWDNGWGQTVTSCGAAVHRSRHLWMTLKRSMVKSLTGLIRITLPIRLPIVIHAWKPLSCTTATNGDRDLKVQTPQTRSDEL